MYYTHIYIYIIYILYTSLYLDNLGHVGNMNKDSSSSQGGSMVRFRLLPAVNGSNIFDAVQ